MPLDQNRYLRERILLAGSPDQQGLTNWEVLGLVEGDDSADLDDAAELFEADWQEVEDTQGARSALRKAALEVRDRALLALAARREPAKAPESLASWSPTVVARIPQAEPVAPVLSDSRSTDSPSAERTKTEVVPKPPVTGPAPKPRPIGQPEVMSGTEVFAAPAGQTASIAVPPQTKDHPASGARLARARIEYTAAHDLPVAMPPDGTKSGVPVAVWLAAGILALLVFGYVAASKKSADVPVSVDAPAAAVPTAPAAPAPAAEATVLPEAGQNQPIAEAAPSAQPQNHEPTPPNDASANAARAVKTADLNRLVDDGNAALVAKDAKTAMAKADAALAVGPGLAFVDYAPAALLKTKARAALEQAELEKAKEARSNAQPAAKPSAPSKPKPRAKQPSTPKGQHVLD